MAEYIRRDTLIKRFFEKVDMSERIVDGKTAERFSTFEALMDVVMDMPTIDIEEEDKQMEALEFIKERNRMCKSYGNCKVPIKDKLL